jgi:hypothetical protein
LAIPFPEKAQTWAEFPYPEFISRFAVSRTQSFSMLLFFDSKLKTGALLAKLKDAVHC